MAKSNSNGLTAWKFSGVLIATFISVITTLSLFITNGLRSDIRNLEGKITGVESKLFVHLTNHELHVPRGSVVSKEEFQMHCYTSEKAKEAIEKTLCDFKEEITDYFKQAAFTLEFIAKRNPFNFEIHNDRMSAIDSKI